MDVRTWANGHGIWHAELPAGGDRPEAARAAIIAELAEREGPNFAPGRIGVELVGPGDAGTTIYREVLLPELDELTYQQSETVPYPPTDGLAAAIAALTEHGDEMDLAHGRRLTLKIESEDELRAEWTGFEWVNDCDGYGRVAWAEHDRSPRPDGFDGRARKIFRMPVQGGNVCWWQPPTAEEIGLPVLDEEWLSECQATVARIVEDGTQRVALVLSEVRTDATGEEHVVELDEHAIHGVDAFYPELLADLAGELAHKWGSGYVGPEPEIHTPAMGWLSCRYVYEAPGDDGMDPYYRCLVHGHVSIGHEVSCEGAADDPMDYHVVNPDGSHDGPFTRAIARELATARDARSGTDPDGEGSHDHLVVPSTALPAIDAATQVAGEPEQDA